MNDDFNNGHQNEPNDNHTGQDTAKQAHTGEQGGQYYNPNGQYYNPNGQYYNPNGQYYNPNQDQYYNPNGQYNHANGAPGPFHPNSFFYPPQQTDTNGKTSQTFGIVALVSLFFCQILSIIFGALALSNAKKSIAALGYECSEAKSGRVMGLVGLIVGGVQIGLIIFVFILALSTSLFAAGVV